MIEAPNGWRARETYAPPADDMFAKHAAVDAGVDDDHACERKHAFVMAVPAQTRGCGRARRGSDPRRESSARCRIPASRFFVAPDPSKRLSACSFCPSSLGDRHGTTCNPSSGARFLTRDPLASVTREAYGYAGNDPINNTDPTGLYCLTGKNPNGSCRSISREAGRRARAAATSAQDNVGHGIGIAAELTGGERRELCDGVTVIEGSWLVPPGADAWTVGHTIIGRDEVDGRLLRHELVHVAQLERDAWFAFRYLKESLLHGYDNNKYEVEAREEAAK